MTPVIDSTPTPLNLNLADVGVRREEKLISEANYPHKDESILRETPVTNDKRDSAHGSDLGLWSVLSPTTDSHECSSSCVM